MAATLKHIINTVEEDREPCLDLLGSIIECIRLSPKMAVSHSNGYIDFSIPHYPNDVVYFNRYHVYIPERLLNKNVSGETYLGVADMVEILKNTRVHHKPILADKFYKELHVSTPVGKTTVDTLVLNYKTFAYIIGAIGKDPE